MRYESKKYEDLFFTDDFLLCKIMREPEIAKDSSLFILLFDKYESKCI